jgi:hypothetical protein
MISDKQFIFIIGSLKSGTTWLQIMLGAHPQICTTVEQTLFDKYIPSWFDIWQKETQNISIKGYNKGLPFLWTNEEFTDFLLEFLNKVYSKVLINNPDASHILDKNPMYSFSVELIHELLPNARFIHLIRDGRDVAGSMLAARRNIGYGPRSFIKSVETWKKYVLAAVKAKKHEDQYLEIRYEDLLMNGQSTLQIVFDFCQLPISSEEIEKIVMAHKFEKMKSKRQHADIRAKTHKEFYRKGQAGNWRDELSLVQMYQFDRLAGDLLQMLGYDRKGWWATSNINRLFIPILGEIPLKTYFMKKNLYPQVKKFVKLIS